MCSWLQSIISLVCSFHALLYVLPEMNPGSQQQAPAIKHMMTIPEKIELTATGGYPAAGQLSGQRQDSHAYRAMRVPDKIMLEETGVGGGGEGHGQGGTGVYFKPTK